MPGGEIFITTAMLDFVESDAELASVLAHEIAHVDQRHAIERLLARITVARILPDDLATKIDLAPALVRAGYRKYQELEADAAGLRIATAAGYDPGAAVDTFRRLAARDFRPERRRARDPVSEMGAVVLAGIGSCFDSHPPTTERIERLERLIASRRRYGGPR